MRYLLVKCSTVLFACLFLSGCYSFEEDPYAVSDLKPLSDTKFGGDLLKDLLKVENKQLTESGLVPTDIFDDLGNESLVREISPNFIIFVHKDDSDGTWMTVSMQKNEHHIFICFPMEYKDIKIDKNINVKKTKTEFYEAFTLSGEQTALKKIADKLNLFSQKVCLAFAYADASKVKYK